MTGHRAAALAVMVLGLAATACSDSPLEYNHLTQAVETLKVAAIQYTDGSHTKVDPTCAQAADGLKDACAIKKYIADAKAQGAVLFVTPEDGVGQQYLEPDPEVGDLPATSTKWGDDELVKVFSQQALQHQMHVVLHLQTYSGQNPNTKKYKAQLAFDPTGKIVAKHHKFELYGAEANSLTPGTDVTVFDTPAGKVGLLICADMYGDLRLQDKLVNQLEARVVAVSSMWTVKGGWRWQAAFAKNWGVYVVGSQAALGPGVGGGIFDTEGKTLDLWESTEPHLTIASIPAP